MLLSQDPVTSLYLMMGVSPMHPGGGASPVVVIQGSAVLSRHLLNEDICSQWPCLHSLSASSRFFRVSTRQEESLGSFCEWTLPHHMAHSKVSHSLGA